MPELSAAALREWGEHVESVMRGLAHALNNRAAALSAILEMSREPDDDPAMTQSILETEFRRVRELADTVRAVGPPAGTLETVSPGDVVTGAVALLTLHAGQRDRAIDVDSAGAPPVRVAPWMLLRALVVLCASAPTTDPARRTLRVTLRHDGDWMTARVVPPPDGAMCDSGYVAELVRAMGGEPLAGGFRIPTLAALRRREGP
jgi:hypothetical protein